MFTTSIDDFYNFATNRVMVRYIDFLCTYVHADYRETPRYSKVLAYVKDYCKLSISEITHDLQEIDTCKSIDEKYDIYNDIYWFIFDEDDFKEDFKHAKYFM